MAKYLNLGCGAEVIERPDWENVDAEPRAPGVLKADIRALPHADGSVDGIAASHVLEHMEWPVEVLREWARVLKPGGEVLVAVPDASREAEWLGHHLVELRARGGGEGHDHHVDFTAPALCAALREAGFEDVRAVDPALRWELPGKADWQACASGRKPCE